MKLFCHSIRLETGGTHHRIFCCSIRPSSLYFNPIFTPKTISRPDPAVSSYSVIFRRHLYHSSRYPFISPFIEFHLKPLFEYQVVNSPKENKNPFKDYRRMRLLARRKDHSVRNKITGRS